MSVKGLGKRVGSALGWARRRLRDLSLIGPIMDILGIKGKPRDIAKKVEKIEHVVEAGEREAAKHD